MADYRITCVIKSDPVHPHYHSHIVRVGIGDDNVWHDMMTVDQVYSSINAGNRFYTKSKSTGAVALVHAYHCRQCATNSLQSAADSVPDNNLDSLPQCGPRQQ
jgi:exo-beta-1,3-glucanase (GH17 family)